MLFDMHVHTAEGSPCAVMSARELVNRYKEKGFDGIVVTDHIARYYMENRHKVSYEDYCKLNYEAYLLAKDEGDKVGLTVLHGCELELAGSNNDYLLYGITKDFLLECGDIISFSLQKLKEVCDNNSILYYQAHPFRDGITVISPELLYGVETINGAHIHYNNGFRNEVASIWADKYNLHRIAGSDCHSATGVGFTGVKFFKEITNNAQLVDALKNDEYYLIESVEANCVKF